MANYQSQIVSYALQVKNLQPGLISKDILSTLVAQSNYGEGYGEEYGYGAPTSGGARKTRNKRRKNNKSKKAKKSRKYKKRLSSTIKKDGEGKET
jgi:hypothetical protein